MVITETAPATTLQEAYRDAVLLWPGREAPLAAWLVYHQQRAALFATVAESDPDHRHEARHLAGVERRDIIRVTALIAAEHAAAPSGRPMGRRAR